MVDELDELDSSDSPWLSLSVAWASLPLLLPNIIWPGRRTWNTGVRILDQAIRSGLIGQRHCTPL